MGSPCQACYVVKSDDFFDVNLRCQNRSVEVTRSSAMRERAAVRIQNVGPNKVGAVVRLFLFSREKKECKVAENTSV